MKEIEKKFELIPSDKEGLYRVKALRDFGNVKKGDIGGYVESENNLSHEGNCWIYDNAIVDVDAKVQDYAIVCGNAIVSGNAIVCGEAHVYDNAIVGVDAKVQDYAIVCDNAIVRDNMVVYGNADICGDAIISSEKDYIVFKNWWSSGRCFTWTRSNNMWKVGCFYGTGEELVKKAYKDSEKSGREYERIVRYVEEILKEAKNEKN